MVIVLAMVAGVGFALYETKPGAVATLTSTEVSTQSFTVTHSMIPAERMNAIPFLPQPYQNVHDAWLLFAPTDNRTFVLTIHVEGLPSTQGTGDYYIARGLIVNQTIELVPLGESLQSSTLLVNSNGVGNLYVVLTRNPGLAFHAIQIARVDGTNSSRITTIATASLLPQAAG